VIQLEIERKIINCEDFKVPCAILKPTKYVGAAVVVHGYGGFKEETLGLAWRIAEQGFITGAIDLRGHGEHPLDLDENILLDLEASISYFRQFGKVTAIGHSLGGRLSLISSADYAIGIAPALDKTYSPQTQELIEEMRDYRVSKSNSNIFNILNNLPKYQIKDDKVFILHGSRDLPEIISECNKLKSEGLDIFEIDEALHGDIFLFEPTFKAVNDKMEEWYK
jgi:esterase/lipase